MCDIAVYEITGFRQASLSRGGLLAARAVPFYPSATKSIASERSSVEMRAIIDKLRAMGPENAAYDELFLQLMREVMHHVADEETVLLPAAERALEHELRPLGAKMTRRRLQLLGQRPREIALNTAGTLPLATF
ncbi:hypothetical protein LMG28138_04684 [Pararobbsia alpina]|uniref:Hemerythrin-like domain-containing protein n=1 Tax=Pararobbsia alpina TaxID=621374 RepID=A0A6S7C254_9BURK|nr:hypothetical protein LMG28138_04684 [Pararobbsia alpina]